MNRFFQSIVRLIVSVAVVGIIPGQIWAQNAAGRILGNATAPADTLAFRRLLQ
jgi:hypothetical protein